MKIGSSGSAGSLVGFSSRLKSINLRPVVGQAEGTDSASGSSSEQPDEASENSSQSLFPEDSSRDSSPSSRGSSRDEFPFYNPGGEASSSTEAVAGESSDESSGPSPTSDLSPAEQRKVQELKRIDSRVRSHEQAHLAAAGSHAQGGISLEYVQGPDGQRYAVGGEVQLDASKGSTPEETVQKLRRVKAAALAPANPSPQDLKIASQASRKLAEAQAERSEGGESSEGENDTRANGSSGKSTGPRQPNSENTSPSNEEIEGPSDIGVDVTEDVGTFIADRTESTGEPSSGASNSVQNDGVQNGARSSSAATYGPEPGQGGASPASEGASRRGQAVNLLI